MIRSSIHKKLLAEQIRSNLLLSPLRSYCLLVSFLLLLCASFGDIKAGESTRERPAAETETTDDDPRDVPPPDFVDCDSEPELLEKIPEFVGTCPDCSEGFLQDNIDAANESIEKINKLKEKLHALQCDDDPRDVVPPGACKGEKKTAYLVWEDINPQNKRDGTFTAEELEIVHPATGGQYTSFYSSEQLLLLLEREVGDPVDIEGKCGNCIKKLTILSHGCDPGQTLGFRFGEIQIKPGGEFDTVQSDIKDYLFKMRRYLCTDGTLVIFQCSAAYGEDGSKLGEALADFLGVNVIAPNFSPYIETGSEPESIEDAIKDFTPGGDEEWIPFVPKDPIDDREELLERQISSIKKQLNKLSIKLGKLLNDIGAEKAAYERCAKFCSKKDKVDTKCLLCKPIADKTNKYIERYNETLEKNREQPAEGSFIEGGVSEDIANLLKDLLQRFEDGIKELKECAKLCATVEIQETKIKVGQDPIKIKKIGDEDGDTEEESTTKITTGGSTTVPTVKVINNIPVSRLFIVGSEPGCSGDHYHGSADNCNGVFTTDPNSSGCGHGLVSAVKTIPKSACPDL